MIGKCNNSQQLLELGVASGDEIWPRAKLNADFLVLATLSFHKLRAKIYGMRVFG